MNSIGQVLKEELELLLKLRETVSTRQVADEIRKPQFTVKDIGISSRILNHWDKSGLLMESYTERRWRRLNLIEYVWLKIIVELRQYDMSHKVITSVKNSLCFDFGINDYNIKEEVIQRIPEFAKPHQQERVVQIMNTREFHEYIRDLKINYLETVIQYIILLKGNYSLLVNKNGECIPLKHSCIDTYLQMEEFNEFLSNTYISISITRILKDFLLENEVALPKKRLALLSNAESQIIKSIREEEVTSIIVKKDNAKKIELIEEFRSDKVDKASRLMDLILSSGYQTIEIKTQQGNIVSYVNKIKKKIQE